MDNDNKGRLEGLNNICAACMEAMADCGGVNSWYCENMCETGRAIHELEKGSDWDLFDKTSSKYRQTIDGD